MKKRERLEALINHYCDGNKSRFAAQLGISPQTLSHWVNRDTMDFETVYAKCPGLSADWLLSGKGEMFRQQNDNRKQNDNTELLLLCASLVENYHQRDDIMSKLVSLIKNK